MSVDSRLLLVLVIRFNIVNNILSKCFTKLEDFL